MSTMESRDARVSGFASDSSSRAGIIAVGLPLLVFFLALAPRLTDLGRLSFWSDEVITAHRAAMPIPLLILDAFTWHHTPFYFLLITPFAHMSDLQFWLRLPSAVLGALNVMLVFVIAARVGGRTAGIAAALIIGLAPTEIAYSQEARSYMLMIFFLLIALQALIKLAQSGEQAALPWRAGHLGWVWAQFISGSAAALCTLGDSLPWLAAAGVSAIVLIFRARNQIGLAQNFIAANAISLGCCVPVYMLMLHFEGRIVIQLNEPVPIPALVWYDVGSIYLMRVCDFVTPHFMAVPTPQALTGCIGAGLGLAALGGVWRLRRDPAIAAVLLPAVLMLPFLFGLVSIHKPLLTARYLLWSGPPFAILAGLGIGAALDKCPASTRYGALAAASLLLLINLAPFYHVETKPGWQLAGRIFAAQARPQDVAYYCFPEARQTMAYYLPTRSQPYLLYDLHDNLAQLQRARGQGKRVWVIYGDDVDVPHWRSLAYFQTFLAPLGAPSAELKAGSRIIMWRYDPPKM